MIKDRIAEENMKELSRHNPTPLPYIWHIREKFHSDGRVELIHCWVVDDWGVRGKCYQ